MTRLMSTPESDAHDPIADERGEKGTNYPHGVGYHPDSTETTDPVDPIADERGKEGTNYPHGVGEHKDSGHPDADAWDDDLK
jgi:hypothetical protein